MTSPTTPPSGGWRFLKSNAATLAAVGGYVIALGVALTGFGVVNAERAASTMVRYGNAVAEDLAHHAVDPLLRRDRIQLGLLTNRIAARPEVHRIAIHTVDERLFVVAGSTASGPAPTYIRPITVQDTVAGDVRVMLNADVFSLPITRVLAESWQFALAGLALTVFLFHFGSHLGVRARASPRSPGEAAPAVSSPTFVVVAELSAPPASGSAMRDALMARGMSVARRVANLYAGHVVELEGSGIVLLFPVSRSSDRCFEVVCAALLVCRLLTADHAPRGTAVDGEPGTTDEDKPSGFRYGIDLAETGVPVDAHTVRASAVSGILLLASFAGDGELVLGQAAYDALGRPERVELEDLNNPATEALSPSVVKPRGRIRGIAGEYEALLSRQTEVIAKASAP